MLSLTLTACLLLYFIAKKRYLRDFLQIRGNWLPLVGGIFLAYLLHRLLVIDESAVRSLVTSGGDVSIDTRFVLWSASLLMGVENPFWGVGLGNFNYSLADAQIIAQEKLGFLYETRTYTNWSHNEYLQLLAEGGLPAFLLFTGLAIWVFRRLLVGVVKEGRGNDPAFVYSHLLLFPFFFMAVFSWPFRFAPLLALFALFLGCALSHGPTVTWTPDRLTRRTFQGLALCAVALIVYLMTLEAEVSSLQKKLHQGTSAAESFVDFQKLSYNPQTRYAALTRILPQLSKEVLDEQNVDLALRLIPFAEDLTEMERAYWQWLLLARLYHLVGLQEKAREAAEMSIHQQPVHEPAWQFLHYIDMTRAAEETGRPIESFLPDTLPASHPFKE